jgi:hypothetical protein
MYASAQNALSRGLPPGSGRKLQTGFFRFMRAIAQNVPQSTGTIGVMLEAA